MSESDFTLAIDVGNSRVIAAVVHHAGDARENPVLFSLSGGENSASSAVFIDDDALYFGETAEDMGAAAPERLIREFAHAVGDDVPCVVGERSVTADELFASVCAWIVDEVTTAEGGPPALIAITHPASWGGHRLARMRAALVCVGIDEPLLIADSEASATSLECAHPLDTGQLLAVYDLGGTRFDARVLRRLSGGRYQPVGEQVGIDQLGGANFDDALLRRVLNGAPLGDDGDALPAIAGIRRAVVHAKELLSSTGDATVQLALPSGAASVRVTRSEFESLIDADLDRTVEALDLAIESADAQADRIAAIVLVGGSSRIPLVAQRLSERFDLPIIADADPQAATVLGAALVARRRLHDIETAPGTAIVSLANSEKTPAPKSAPASERTGVLAFLRPLIGKPSRSTSPLLLAGAAVFIAVTIVFSSTTAAGTRWPDYVQAAAADLLNLPRPTGLSAPASPKPAPVSATDPRDTKDASPVNRTNRASEDAQTEPARKSSRTTATSPTAPATSSGGGPKVEPTSPPVAPPDTTPEVVPGSGTDDTTPTGGTTPDETPPPATEPPADTSPPADTTPPADTSTPTETPPPADTTPPAETNPPTDTTPPAEDPPAEVPPVTSPTETVPVEEPAPVSTPGPAPELV